MQRQVVEREPNHGPKPVAHQSTSFMPREDVIANKGLLQAAPNDVVQIDHTNDCVAGSIPNERRNRVVIATAPKVGMKLSRRGRRKHPPTMEQLRRFRRRQKRAAVTRTGSNEIDSFSDRKCATHTAEF